MITLTPLRTQLQNRIDAITGATTTNDLLNLRKACESMGVNHATIDAEIQARVNAVSGATSSIDLLKLSKLSIRGDKRIGEIVESPIKADTLDDGALIRMAGVKVLKTAYPALAEVYQDQVLFGVQVSLDSALSSASVSVTPYMYESVYANGALMIAGARLVRSVDGAAFAIVGPNLQFTAVCFDEFNSRWWAGTESGLLYYSIDNGLTWAQNSAYSNGGIHITSVSVSKTGTILTTFLYGSASTGGAKYSINNGSAWVDCVGLGSGIGVAHSTYSAKHNLFFAIQINSTSLNISSDGINFSSSGYFGSPNFPAAAKYYRRLRVFGDYVVLQTNNEQYAIRIGASGSGLGAAKVIGVSEITEKISNSSYCMFAQLFDGSVLALPRAAVTPKPSALYRYTDIFGFVAQPIGTVEVGTIVDSFAPDSQMYGGNIYSCMCETPWGVFIGTAQDRSKCILIPTKNYSSTEMYLPDTAPRYDKAGAAFYSYVVAK